jgi:hypothetical protein
MYCLSHQSKIGIEGFFGDTVGGAVEGTILFATFFNIPRITS